MQWNIELKRFLRIQGVDILLLDEPVAKIKAVISEYAHISIFYNADTAGFEVIGEACFDFARL